MKKKPAYELQLVTKMAKRKNGSGLKEVGWFWRLVATRNNRVLATSENYFSRDMRARTAKRFFKLACNPKNVLVTEAVA